jgi:transposase
MQFVRVKKVREKLAGLRHGNCEKSEEEIAKALQSNGRKDYLFGLKQKYRLYINFWQKMKEYDLEIEKLLKEQINNNDDKKQHYIDTALSNFFNRIALTL